MLFTLITTAAVLAAGSSDGSVSSIPHPAAVVHAGGKYTLTNVSDAGRRRCIRPIADRPALSARSI
jgi:hypothetical protein